MSAEPITETAPLEITGAIPRLREATVSALAEHLRTTEASVATTLRVLLDDDVVVQAGAGAAGDATYATVAPDPA